jgi:hypothetical protein
MQKLPGKRFGILVTVSLVIILAMGFYYFHIQSVKEDKVTRQAFKTLYRYAGDLREKEREIKKSRAYSFSVISQDLERVNKVIDSIKPIYKEMSEIEFAMEDNYGLPFYELSDGENLEYLKQYDSLMMRYIIIESHLNKFVLRLENILPIMQRRIERVIKNRYNYDENVIGDYLFYDIDYIKESPNSHLELAVDSILNEIIAPYLSRLPVPKKEVFPDILDKEFFAGFIAFDLDKCIYNQFYNTQIELTQKKFKQSVRLDTLLHLFKSDEHIELSLEGGSSKFSIANPHELQLPISLKGQDYQLFIVKVDGINVQYLAGLMPKGRHASLKRGLDRGMVSVITIFVLLLLLSIPIVKLFVVAPGEEYTIRSLITLVLSSVGLVFIISYFVLYQSNIAYIKKHVKDDDEHLQKIARSIKQNFKKELDTMLINLESIKWDISKLSNGSKDSILKKELHLKNLIADNRLLKDSSLNWLDIILARSIKKVMVGENKRVLNNLELLVDSVPGDYALLIDILHNNFRYTDVDTLVGGDLRRRNYLREPKRFKKGVCEFGMESIFSLTTAEPQVIISTSIDTSGLVACLASEMSSVYNTILPHGYSFCVIDKDGKVWFHNDSKNNIRENLFVETENNPELMAAVASHRKDEFMTDYKMKPMLMHVAPMDTELGLFIITMCELNNYTQLVNQTGYIIIAAYILILLFWLIISSVYRLWKNSQHGINKPPHVLLFFFPKDNNKTELLWILTANIVTILLLGVISLLFVRRIYVIHWIGLIALIGGSLLIWNLRVVNKKWWNEKTCHWCKAIIAPAVGFALYEIIIPSGKFELSFYLSLFILTGFNILYLFYYTKNEIIFTFPKWKIVTWIKTICQVCMIRRFETNSDRSLYYYMIFSLLFVFVVTPLFVLYNATYQQESFLYHMDQQRYVADHIVQRRFDFIKQKNNKDVIKQLSDKGNYYTDFHEMKFNNGASSCYKGFICKEKGIFTKLIKFMKNRKSAQKDTFYAYIDNVKSTENYAEVFGQARANMFFINNLIEDRGNRVKPSFINSEDDNVHYSYFVHEGELILYVKKGGYPHNNEQFTISMKKPCLSDICQRYLGFVYSSIVIIILFVIYFPKLANKYLFPHFKYNKDLFTEQQGKDQLHSLIEKENKYIVTMPDKAFYKYCIEQESTSIYRLHLPMSLKSFIHDYNANKHVFLFIDHMSFKGVNNLEFFVDAFENYLEKEQFLSLNIVCFKVPRVLIEHFRETLISELRKTNKKTAKKQMQLETTLKRLINCLAYFSMSYIPIIKQPIKDEVQTAIKDHKLKWQKEFKENKDNPLDKRPEQWKKHISWIEAEIGDNASMIDKYKLFRRQDSLSENAYRWDESNIKNSKNLVINEDNVYQAYLINRTYYQKIWDSCSNEEKSILYDIAEDYVINLHKNGVVNILINKGLIKNGQFLKLFNLSFTLFVTRQEEEVDTINASLREHSKTGWSQYSLPLKLLGVAIVVFLIVTQQEFLTGIQSILISIGAILTFALRFFNFPLKGAG